MLKLKLSTLRMEILQLSLNVDKSQLNSVTIFNNIVKPINLILRKNLLSIKAHYFKLKNPL
jgi:hypothetical protein